ncbi:unnamed protein product [Linum trigynum]|uniref:Uncharacterized protein n=1 Tax=Linum trigynum TaxID=586398 RepID=A0AAV2FFC7_9ROSI
MSRSKPPLLTLLTVTLHPLAVTSSSSTSHPTSVVTSIPDPETEDPKSQAAEKAKSTSAPSSPASAPSIQSLLLFHWLRAMTLPGAPEI